MCRYVNNNHRFYDSRNYTVISPRKMLFARTLACRARFTRFCYFWILERESRAVFPLSYTPTRKVYTGEWNRVQIIVLVGGVHIRGSFLPLPQCHLGWRMTNDWPLDRFRGNPSLSLLFGFDDKKINYHDAVSCDFEFCRWKATADCQRRWWLRYEIRRERERLRVFHIYRIRKELWISNLRPYIFHRITYNCEFSVSKPEIEVPLKIFETKNDIKFNERVFCKTRNHWEKSSFVFHIVSINIYNFL